MAEEKGRILLFGRRWSGRTTLANMLVSGEIRECPLNPTDIDSICKTYVGRGWTVIDTMGFGEPLDDIAPDEYATEMAISFLNEVRGSYSHIIFVVDGREVGGDPCPSIEEHRKLTVSMWKKFLEIFRGGEERFVILVTKSKLQNFMPHAWPRDSREVEERFPECKRFLYSDFFNEGFLYSGFFKKVGGDDGQGAAAFRGEAIERLEKEMEEMCKGRPWVEPNVTNMGEDKIKEMAARITHQLKLSLVGDPEWEISNEPMFGSMYDSTGVSGPGLSSEVKLKTVLKVWDEMENLGKEVKLYPRQCEYLLKTTKDVVKEIHDLVYGNETNWDEDRPLIEYLLKRTKDASKGIHDLIYGEDQCLELLIRALSRVVSCMVVGKELLYLCGEGVQEEVVLAMSSRTDSGRNSFSKFALVLRDLEWSLDLFRFWWHIVNAEDFTESEWPSWLSEFFRWNVPKALSATESERKSWRSKFSWCEARRRLVYVGDGESGVARTKFIESGVVGDNKRHTQDQQDLISSMESHFRNPKKVENWLGGGFFFQAKRMEQVLDSERSNYMSVLKNRLQCGDLPLQGDLTFQRPSRGSSRVPRCFQLSGNQEYKSIQLIGKGSYKEVFKSKWLGMNVALATSKSGGQERAPTSVLEAEAEMLARVQHPNVVTLIGYGYDEEKQQGVLVTELLETSLESMINKAMFKPWSWKRIYPFSIFEAIAILLQIVEAMIHVHECGVIHRDLKPENCISNGKFDGNGSYVVKLIDLGTAEMGSRFKTPNIGTPPWMAPEVYGRAGDLEGSLYTMSADVYSFGMTCYQVITGNRPFGTMIGSALRKKVCDGHRPDIPSNCPDELRQLMTECWAHIAEDRPTFKDIERRLWNFKLDCSIWK